MLFSSYTSQVNVDTTLPSLVENGFVARPCRYEMAAVQHAKGSGEYNYPETLINCESWLKCFSPRPGSKPQSTSNSSTHPLIALICAHQPPNHFLPNLPPLHCYSCVPARESHMCTQKLAEKNLCWKKVLSRTYSESHPTAGTKRVVLIDGWNFLVRFSEWSSFWIEIIL